MVKNEPASRGSREDFTPQIWLEGGQAILNRSGGILEINSPLSAWLEKPVTELIGESFWEFLTKISPAWAVDLGQLAESSGPFGHLNLILSPRENRPPQWFDLETARTAQGFFVRLNSALRPMSEPNESDAESGSEPASARRDTFGRLLRAGARLEGLTHRLPCVVFSQRPDFSLRFTSPNIQELTGLDAGEWCGGAQHFWSVVHESDAAELRQQFKRAVQANKSTANTYRIRHAHTGRVRYILEHRQPVLGPDALLFGYEVVWLDVTRQTIAERRLATAAWKETLAALTLGMAHDFTNVIAGIHALSESFLTQMPDDHPFFEGLSLIKKSSLQASQLVHRMVSLHVGQTGEHTYVNLNEFVHDVTDVVKKTLPRRILFDVELADAPLPVYLDVVEFRRAVINLLLNAADAMPRGGRLTLRTTRHETAPVLENMKGAFPRLPCVCLTVQDTGSGIKRRHLASIFDPFFTTKTKGSGLGLYNVRLAIEKLQGAISVISQEGIGTSFQIWLPEADFSESNSEPECAASSRQTRYSLLVLGQPGELLDKTAELLRSHNYHIVTAGYSDSLSELLQSADYQFHGVMIFAEPGEAALNFLPAEIREQNKNLKLVIKLAGCNPDDLDAQFLRDADVVLTDDLSEADLLGKLRSFLDHGG